MAKVNPNSKRSQLLEIYRRRYGNKIESPSVRQQKTLNEHRELNSTHLKGTIDFIGMYAGYYIFTERDPHRDRIVYVATRLRKPEKWSYEGEERISLTRTHWVFGDSEQGIIEGILLTMVNNSGYRGRGTATIEAWMLPRHLRPYL